MNTPRGKLSLSPRAVGSPEGFLWTCGVTSPPGAGRGAGAEARVGAPVRPLNACQGIWTEKAYRTLPSLLFPFIPGKLSPCKQVPGPQPAARVSTRVCSYPATVVMATLRGGGGAVGGWGWDKGSQEINPSTHKPRPLWTSSKAGGWPPLAVRTGLQKHLHWLKSLSCLVLLHPPSTDLVHHVL